jgi:hypothetical protein
MRLYAASWQRHNTPVQAKKDGHNPTDYSSPFDGDSTFDKGPLPLNQWNWIYFIRTFAS